MKKRYIATTLGIIVCAGIGILVGTENYTVSAFADTTILTVENYTKSDNLLKEDGTQSGRTIQSFATEIKSTVNGADCSELTQVIPREYLESTTTNAVYQYNGKEYGFYLNKEGDYFDLLLIDFVYEFVDGEVHNQEFKIQIKPILEQYERRADCLVNVRCILAASSFSRGG